MPVTRINNNQISDASAGNAFLGINAAVKLQNYSVTATKIANNLTYGSDLTITGNLTIQGNTTTVDTTYTTIEDPVILLASNQTGSPAVDIGFIGERGTSQNIAFVWDESASEFVTVFTNDAETNTTVSIASYASFHTKDANIGGNIVINGTTSLVGSVIGNVSLAGNITMGNVLTNGQVSAAGNVTGGNLNTGGQVIATSNITGGNLLTSGTVSAASHIGSVVSVSGNVTGGNLLTGGLISSTGNITSAANVSGGNVLSSALVQGVTISASGNVISGNITTAGQVSATGNITSAANITGGNLLTSGTVSAASYIGSVVSVSGNITSAANIAGGNLLATTLVQGVTVSASGNVIGGNITTAGQVSATGNITSAANVAGGNVIATTIVSGASVLGTIVSASGNVTGGNVLTGGLISATGNITSAANVAGGNLVATTAVVTPTVIGTTVTVSSTGGLITLAPSSNVSVSSKNINNLAQPVQDQDAATKLYVDNMVSTQLSYHQGVFAATTGTLETATGGTFNLIDTANIQTANTRVLVKNQANAALNGIYRWANATALIRTSDADEYGPNSAEQLSINDYFFVSNGNVNAGSAWIVDSPTGTITFGTSNIQFAQFSSSQTYSAGNGISLVGTVITAKVDNNTTAFDVGGNIIVKASANLTTPNIGAATGTSLSVTGNLTGAGANISGNVTSGNILTTGIVSGASLLGSVVSASGNVTGGNILTGGLISATGNITSAANVAGGNLIATTTVSAPSHIGTTVSVTANITGGNILTGGLISATGTITSAANVIGGNVTTAGQVSATANITGGNILTPGIVSAAGNIIGGTDLYIGNGAASTAFTNPIAIFRDNGTGYVQVAVVNATGTASADLVTYGNNGDDSQSWMDMGFTGNTFSDTNYSITAPGDGYLLAQGNTATGGNLVISTGNIGNTRDIVFGFGFLSTNEFVRFQRSTNTILPYANLTANIGSSSKYLSNVYVGNTFGTMISATGNITGANLNTGGANSLTLWSSTINSNAERIVINSANTATDFAVHGLSTSNVFFINATTKTASFGSSTQTTNAIVAFNANTSVLMPVGTTTQRPGTGVTGMMRFNSTTNSVEVFDNSAWTAVGVPSFTIVADDQFTGNGVQTAFTLSSNAYTTNSVIVSINGVIQIPTSAYSVSGATLTFTEAPQTGDLIDVRELVTTTQVTSIANSPGNAVVAVNPTVNQVSITGNLVPVANSTQSLGTSSLRWKDIYVSGNTIYLGGLQLQASGNTFVVYTSDGVTQANIDVGNIDVSAINSGTSTVGISAPNGNAYVTVGGTSNVLVVSSTGVSVSGLISASGNITGGNLITGGTLSVTGNIVSTGSNGVANIGSATTYFNTVHAKATSAQYADLAENYAADAEYEPGTVLSFGGEQEVTISAESGDRRIAGVVSTNPSYIMNSTLDAEHVVTIALTGRVPTFVSGPVAKGDMMVSAGNGRAVACSTPAIGTVIGKALENHSNGDGVIEVVVGRL